jgi:enterochelin esterase family protein
MANALKLKGYDFHFSFGHGSHNTGHGEAQFPREMIWLWPDYGPSKTSQTFEIEPEEKTKPRFRVTIANRSAE